MTVRNSIIKLHNLEKKYISISGQASCALTGIELEVFSGEFLTIVGPSGSGKSTLLKIMAQMTAPTRGEIEFVGEKQRIGFVFQEDALLPWRTVERNLAYPLELHGVSLAIQKKRTQDICRLIGLAPDMYLNKFPKELSGGEKRRVAVGMTIAYEASLLLLDEPTSQLDDLNKWLFQQVLQDLWLQRRFTTVLVTHDLEEAVYLGDRVIIIQDGELRATIEVGLKRPRTDNDRLSEQVRDYRAQIGELYKKFGSNGCTD